MNTDQEPKQRPPTPYNQGKERRDFFKELNRFMGTDVETVNELIAEISRRSYTDDRSRNIVYQYLRKIANQKPDHREAIGRFLTCLKRARFKAFKINLAHAFHSGGEKGRFEGNLEICLHYFNILRLVYKDELVVLSHTTRINIEPFLKSRNQDLIVDDQVQPSVESELLTRGCGCSGCCETIYWNVSHQDEQVIISDIFWGGLGYKPEENLQHIVGEYAVDKRDFVSEIDRLENIYRNAKAKGSKELWRRPSVKRRKRLTE